MNTDVGPSLGVEDYRRAERFLPWNVVDVLFDAEIEAHWIEQSDRFWYLIRRPRGSEFVLVDPERDVHEPAFDHARLAAGLSRATGTAIVHTALPFCEFEFIDGQREILFRVDDSSWVCNLETYRCERCEAKRAAAPDELASPDGNWAAFIRDYNLFVRSLNTGEERQLTRDGVQWYGYGGKPDGRGTKVADILLERTSPPVALWSPDSRRLVTHRLDERQIPEMYLVQTVLPTNEYRPVLHPYRSALVGDEHVALADLVVIDVEHGQAISIEYEPLQSNYRSPIEMGRVWWDKEATHIHFVHEERGHRTLNLVSADVVTGETRTIHSESSDTAIDIAPTPFFESPNARILSDDEFIWYSTQDGWGHLYLHDTRNGALKSQITSGPWTVHEIKHVDAEGRWVYLLAGGKEEGRNPYLRHLYRARLDGSELTLLTAEDADHEVTFSPSGRVFVDTFSRVDRVATSVLRSCDGCLIQTLEDGDIAQLEALGWKPPEPFSVKARDGVTDLYGVIVRPSTFDPARKYPVLDSIYPGPQITRTPRRFAAPDAFGWLWQEQALAELGFIVVTIDGQGTPYRSKAFMDIAYGQNFGEAGGLADHVAGLRQLGARHPAFDLDRVGIYGHSGGGYASARALMTFPDFYKVAVSSSGNHDQHGYIANWGERYIGLPDGDNYRDQANFHLADNLQGKLLLAYGGLDDNVPPGLTLQLVDALIRANKDFELLVLPHCDHTFVDFRKGRETYESPWPNIDRYFVRRRWDFFVRQLLCLEPPKGFVLA